MCVAKQESLQLTSKEGVKKVILAQFLLHEVAHHRPSKPSDAAPMTLPTKAHRMADVYKCLHQGTFGYGPAGGVKHIPSPEYFEKHLTDDYYSTTPAVDAPVLESVTPNDAIQRVNLRPYRKIFDGRDDEGFDQLKKVVMDASLIEKGSAEALRKALDCFKTLNHAKAFCIDDQCYIIPLQMVERFIEELEKYLRVNESIPLLSHSKAYHRLNRPSYVVVDLPVLEESPLAFLLDASTSRFT